MSVRPYGRVREVGGLALVELEMPRGLAMPGDGDDWRELVQRTEDLIAVKRLLAKARRSDAVANQPGTSWVLHTGAAAIALVAATAKTLMYLNSGASDQPVIAELSIGFDGVSASAVPVYVELCFGTKATNSTPGTGSTSFTPVQQRGWPAQTPQSTAANACTSEPTVLTTVKHWLVTPNSGLVILPAPLGRELTGVASGTAQSGNQIGLRNTAPAAVNARGYFEFEE